MTVCSCGYEHDEATCPSCGKEVGQAAPGEGRNEPQGNFSWLEQVRDDPISIEETPVASVLQEMFSEDEATKQLTQDEIDKILSTNTPEVIVKPEPSEQPEQIKHVLEKADPRRRLEIASSEVQEALKQAGLSMPTSSAKSDSTDAEPPDDATDAEPSDTRGDEPEPELEAPAPPPPGMGESNDTKQPASRPAMLPPPSSLKGAAEFGPLADEESIDFPSAEYRPASIEVETAEPPSLEFALGKLAEEAHDQASDATKPESTVVKAQPAALVPQRRARRWVAASVVLIVAGAIAMFVMRGKQDGGERVAPRYRQAEGEAPVSPADAAVKLDARPAAASLDVQAAPDVVTADAAVADTADTAKNVDQATEPKAEKVGEPPKKRPRKPRPRKPRRPRRPRKPKTIDPFSE